MNKKLSGKPGAVHTDQFHFIKGCALNLGATAFAARCETLERHSESFSTADYAGLRAEFEAVCEYLSGGGARLTA